MFDGNGSTDLDRVIVGCWQLAAGHTADRSFDPMEVVEAYYDAGFRRFDCADIYTGVEAMLGAFRQAHAPADEMAVHTKFVPDRSDLVSLTGEQIERAIDRSRTRLGVETLDLVQFHWWDYGVPGHLAALETLTHLQHQGAIRAIGLTNFDAEHTAEILAQGIPIASIQTQFSLLDRRPARKLAALAERHGVPLLCYGSVAGGLLSDRYLGAPCPAPPHENRSLTKYLPILDEIGGWDALQALLPVLSEIAERRNSDIATVAGAYALAGRGVRACIVGVRHTGHLARHLALRDGNDLTADEVTAIEAARSRFGEIPGAVYELERDRESAHGRIMHYDLNKRAS